MFLRRFVMCLVLGLGFALTQTASAEKYPRVRIKPVKRFEQESWSRVVSLRRELRLIHVNSEACEYAKRGPRGARTWRVECATADIVPAGAAVVFSGNVIKLRGKFDVDAYEVIYFTEGRTRINQGYTFDVR